eukprot:3941816-Rhodomonas_salina.3
MLRYCVRCVVLTRERYNQAVLKLVTDVLQILLGSRVKVGPTVPLRRLKIMVQDIGFNWAKAVEVN